MNDQSRRFVDYDQVFIFIKNVERNRFRLIVDFLRCRLAHFNAVAAAHEIARAGGIIMAGRDIGTVVLPDADLKIFLDASAEERARRRAEERGLTPETPEARYILAQLRRRDELDRNRAVAPLRPAEDAIHIVTDGNAFEQTVDAVVAAIQSAERATAGGRAATPR